MNLLTFFAAGIIPLFVGYLFYNDAFGFGKLWTRENNFTKEFLEKDFNPLVVFGMTYVFGVLLSLAMVQMVIHQASFASMLVNVPDHKDPNTEVGRAFSYIMTNYGSAYRTFGHGAFHGTIYGIFLALPIVGINALFERKSWRYIVLHTAYWTITLALVGGVVCAWGGKMA